jgi:hypothetical protein
VFDGDTVVANGCASDMELVDLTGFTSFSITSTELDGYSDLITISVGLSVYFTPLSGGGCTDMTACNYDSTATVDDGTCSFPSAAYLDCAGELLDGAGCTDMAACNYDSTASIDDESCTFAVTGYDCEGSCLSGTSVVYSSGSFAGANSFLTCDCDGNELASMSSGYSGFSGCVELTEDFQITLTDSYGDTWNGGSLTVGDVTYDGEDLFVGAGGSVAESVTYVVGSCGVPGCTDMAACNYDSTATFDDSSCSFADEGFDCDGKATRAVIKGCC